MDAMECIRTRQSIRSFLPQEVDRELLRRIIEAALWSPSYKNTQPWEVVVLSGQKKRDLSRLLIELFEQGAAPTPDIAAPLSWPAVEQARIDHLFARRKAESGIDLSDPEMLRKGKKANFNFYYAPHAIYLVQDGSLSPWSLFDMGLFAQTLMLAAHAQGIGTVPQAFATDYAKQTKEFLGISSQKRLVLGISLGYPDSQSPANRFRSDRSPLEECCSWLD